MSVTANSAAILRSQAAAVLHDNDAGSWTKAAPRLYPHQWSWDSAFIAIGWAHLDVGRAILQPAARTSGSCPASCNNNLAVRRLGTLADRREALIRPSDFSKLPFTEPKTRPAA